MSGSNIDKALRDSAGPMSLMGAEPPFDAAYVGIVDTSRTGRRAGVPQPRQQRPCV